MTAAARVRLPPITPSSEGRSGAGAAEHSPCSRDPGPASGGRNNTLVAQPQSSGLQNRRSEVRALPSVPCRRASPNGSRHRIVDPASRVRLPPPAPTSRRGLRPALGSAAERLVDIEERKVRLLQCLPDSGSSARISMAESLAHIEDVGGSIPPAPTTCLSSSGQGLPALNRRTRVQLPQGTPISLRACSSAARASRPHREGREFDSHQVHQFRNGGSSSEAESVSLPARRSRVRVPLAAPSLCPWRAAPS